MIAGALADIVIGLAILWRPASRYGLWAALIISLVYVVIGTTLVPRLWADPLGPMLKIWPVLMLNLVAIAIREDADVYLPLKMVHIIGAAVLLGTGAGIAFFMLVAHLRGDPRRWPGLRGPWCWPISCLRRRR